MTDLKPCPFCGNNDIRQEHLEATVLHPAFSLVCDKCLASSGPTSFAEKKAMEQWNTRATEDALRESNEMLSDALVKEREANERLVKALEAIETHAPYHSIGKIAKAALEKKP